MSAENPEYQKVDSTKVPPNPRAPYPNRQFLFLLGFVPYTPSQRLATGESLLPPSFQHLQYVLGEGVDSIQDHSPR